MTWTSNTVAKVELYAAAWADGRMSTARTAMTYTGNGVWELKDYDNKVSDNSANDSRHRFDATLGDGSKLYLKCGLGQDIQFPGQRLRKKTRLLSVYER